MITTDGKISTLSAISMPLRGFQAFLEGLKTPIAGFDFMGQNPKLWRYGILPVALNLLLTGLVLLALPIGGQVNLWEMRRFAAFVAAALCLVIWFVLRENLHRLEKEILWRLYLLKAGQNDMFRQFD